MEPLIKSLVEIAEYLDNQGNTQAAMQVDKIANNIVTIKTAQYVGFQGYAIRNSRCWSNCYRHKRTSNPKMAAQEVWTECQKEYVESLNNDGSKWDKYASTNKMMKSAQHTINDRKLHNEFGRIVTAKINEGADFPTAVFTGLEELKNADINHHALVRFSDTCHDLQNIFDDKLIDLAGKVKIAEATCGLVKESQGFFSSMFDRFRSQGTQNRRSQEGIANVAEKVIQEMQKSTTQAIDSVNKMLKTLDNQQKSMQYFAKINKDAAVAAKIQNVIQQMQQTGPALAKMVSQITYMMGQINNSMAQVAGRVPATTPFSATPEMNQIKAIFQANPAVATGVMNHIYGKGPGPTTPGAQAIVDYINKLDPQSKLALQDFLRS